MLFNRAKALVSPSKYLAFVNVVLSAIGFIKGLLVAGLLGPETYGVIAVIGGINRTVANFGDVRLTDVAARLYYQVDSSTLADEAAYRLNVLIDCVIGNTIIFVLTGILSVIVGWLTISWFTEARVLMWWLIAYALMQVTASITSTLIFLQRFLGHFYFFGTTRMIVQIADVILFIPLMLGIPSIDGYFIANLAGGFAVLILTFIVTLTAGLKFSGLSLGDLRVGATFAQYYQNRRVIFYGNLQGYSKLVHRAADVLIVSLFANDYITGLYKFARSLTDSLYVLYDAFNQTYQPQFLELLSKRQLDQYWHLARRFIVVSIFSTIALIIGELAFLRPFLYLLYKTKYLDSAGTIIALTIPFGLIMGAQLWLWPIFLSTGKLGKYTAVTLLAAILQVMVTVVLFSSLPANPIYAGIAYVSHYLLLIPTMYVLGQSMLSKLSHQPKLSDSL